ncbi:MAG: PEP-CTERM sorting domain-containing protein [Prosthecobacter sp.]
MTHDVPGSGGISIAFSNDSTSLVTGVWDLTAQGGANLTLIESGAQTSLTGTSLQFNLSNSALPLLAGLTLGGSIQYAWQAQAYFDTGSILNYAPDTTYNVSFDVSGNNGLLGSVAGVSPEFSFELIDGSGNALASSSSGTQVDIAGLLGPGVTTGPVNLSYTVAGIVPGGPIGVRFTGGVDLGASALSIGTTFATISNLNITSTPVPEPGGSVLLGGVGLLMLLRRHRSTAAV